MKETNYRIPYLEDGVLSHWQALRSQLKDRLVQKDLDIARTAGWSVYCGCVEEQDKMQILSVIGGDTLHLSRVNRESSLHSFGCFHHKPSAAQMTARGYYKDVITANEDGFYKLDLGGMLLPGAASLEADVPDYGRGEPSGKEPVLRNSMGCFGLLCTIADFASLNASDDWRNEYDFWASIVFAATQLKPVRCNADILQLMLLPGRKIRNQYEVNKVRLQDAYINKRSILVIDLLRLSGDFSMADSNTIARSGPFKVPVRIPTAVFARAKSRHKFAARLLAAGKTVLTLGRAHISASLPSSGVITYTAHVDRLALLGVDDHFTCIPNGTVLKRMVQAKERKEAFSSVLPYEAGLPI